MIIVNEKIRNGWIRGSIAEVMAGQDEEMRATVVQTATGVMERPVCQMECYKGS